MQESYGYQYFLIHRGDLHKVLLDRAYEVGAEIVVNAFVSKIDQETPSVMLRDGTRYTADLIVGADGKLSMLLL